MAIRHTWRGITIAAGGVLVAGIAGLGTIGWFGSERWLRHTTPSESRPSPQDSGLSAEPASFLSRDQTPLRGWFIPAGSTGAPSHSATVVLLHGLRSSRWSLLEHAAYLHRAGYNVLLFDFRASGESSGGDVTFGAREQLDVLGALEYLDARGDVDMRRVGLQGVSMGAVVALLVAAKEPRVTAVVAEAAFSDFRAVVEKSYAHRPAPLRRAQTVATTQMLNWRLGIEVDDISAVRAAGALAGRPLLVIENALDANVPSGSARAISEAASGPREIWVIDGAAHGAGHQRAPEEYERRVLAFWRAAFSD